MRNKKYFYTSEQILPIDLQMAWEFFSSPKNLSVITPPSMGFQISSNLEGKMKEGQVIEYRVSPFPWVRIKWVSLISELQEPSHFIDEQLSGPFSFWKHRHTFKEIEGRVKIIDEVEYAVPWGWLGRAVNHLFIHRQVAGIFKYRERALLRIFSGNK